MAGERLPEEVTSEFLRECVAWETRFGEEPPQEVTNFRDEMLRKTASGEELTSSEAALANVIALDTDFF